MLDELRNWSLQDLETERLIARIMNLEACIIWIENPPVVACSTSTALYDAYCQLGHPYLQTLKKMAPSLGMGLKLQRSCNLVTTLLKNKQNVGDLIFTSQDTQINLSNRLLKLASSVGFDQAQGSMDRLLEQSNREFVRGTMMKQEEIFKQQVRELHQLYRVQKMLLSELRIKESHATATTPKAITDTKNKYWSTTSTSDTSHSSYISNRNHTAPHLKSEYNSLYHNNTTDEEECDVDLTLRIGCSSSKKKLKNRVHSEPTTSETKQECSERECLQRRPPWLFQALSLNRT